MKYVYVLMVHFMLQTSTLDVLILPGKMDFAKAKFTAIFFKPSFITSQYFVHIETQKYTTTLGI